MKGSLLGTALEVLRVTRKKIQAQDPPPFGPVNLQSVSLAASAEKMIQLARENIQVVLSRKHIPSS